MHMAAAGGSSEAVRYLHQNCHLDVNSKASGLVLCVYMCHMYR